MDQGVKIDHSPASGAEVKYEWRHTSVSPTCLPDVGRDSCTFTTYGFRTFLRKNKNDVSHSQTQQVDPKHVALVDRY